MRGDLSQLQRLVLHLLSEGSGAEWTASELFALCSGATPSAVGMALKGLYKRCLVDRRNPVRGERNATYAITGAGSEVLGLVLAASASTERA